MHSSVIRVSRDVLNKFYTTVAEKKEIYLFQSTLPKSSTTNLAAQLFSQTIVLIHYGFDQNEKKYILM